MIISSVVGADHKTSEAPRPKTQVQKILMIAPTPFFADRGCHVRIYEQARTLQKLGHQVTICTYHNGYDVPGLDIRRIVKIPWYRKLEAGPSIHKLYLDVLLFWKALRVALRVKPDVIHAHLHEGALIGLIIGKIVRRPVLFDSQGSLSGELKAHKYLEGVSPFHWLMRQAEKIINLAVPIIVVSSVATEVELNRSLKQRGKVFLVHDGVDTNEFRPDLPTEKLRAQLGIAPDKKVVVYLGLLNTHQGIDCLINSIPLVLGQVPNVHFLIMGYPDEIRYRLQAKRLQIAQHVTFTGRIPYAQTPQYLCLGDVAVAPKLNTTEANGKVYGYMACGLPTVVFDTPMNRQMLGDLGIYATDVGEPESLAQAIIGILSNTGLSEGLGKQLRQMAEKDCSWDSVARNLKKCYDIVKPNQTTK